MGTIKGGTFDAGATGRNQIPPPKKANKVAPSAMARPGPGMTAERNLLDIVDGNGTQILPITNELFMKT
jgi:hypothetical protein